MSDRQCIECGRQAQHQHHVVPRSKGGEATIPLCESCHGKVHDHDLSISDLTSETIQQKRANGEYIGGTVPYGYEVDSQTGQLQEDRSEQWVIDLIYQLRRQGQSLADVADTLNEYDIHPRDETSCWHKMKIHRIIHSDYRSDEARNVLNIPSNTDLDQHQDVLIDSDSRVELLLDLKDQGLSLRDMATYLNNHDIPRDNGHEWHHMAVSRKLDSIQD